MLSILTSLEFLSFDKGLTTMFPILPDKNQIVLLSFYFVICKSLECFEFEPV